MKATPQARDHQFELIPDGNQDPNVQRVLITGIKLPWTNIVSLMVKISFCSIPALAIIFLAYTFIAVLVAGMVSSTP